MSKIIALANQKGGVTKTTSTLNLAAALAAKGHKTLMIDMDSQASLTISTGFEPLELEKTICDLLEKNPIPAAEAVLAVEHIPHLFLIPSSIDLAVLEMEMLSRSSRERILARALAPIRDDYAFILIDCPPQLSILTVNALSAADEVIVPVKTDYLAYRGLTQLMDTIAEIKELINPVLTLSGVIATLFESQVNEDKEILAKLYEDYRVLGVLRKTAAAKKGVYDGLPVVLGFSKTPIAQEYERIAAEIESGAYTSAQKGE